MALIYLVIGDEKFVVIQPIREKAYDTYSHGEFVPNPIQVGDKKVRVYWDANARCLRLARPTEVKLENSSV